MFSSSWKPSFRQGSDAHTSQANGISMRHLGRRLWCGLWNFCLCCSPARCLSCSSDWHKNPGSPEETWTVDNWLVLTAHKLCVSNEPRVIYLCFQVWIEDIWVPQVNSAVCGHAIYPKMYHLYSCDVFAHELKRKKRCLSIWLSVGCGCK